MCSIPLIRTWAVAYFELNDRRRIDGFPGWILISIQVFPIHTARLVGDIERTLLFVLGRDQRLHWLLSTL